MAGTPLLEVSGMHVRLGGAHILQGVDLAVAAGGVTALLGRNGAGKTTTLKAIAGLVPRTGTVRFSGESLGRQPTYRVVRRGIGYVPEDREVFASLTVEENLRLAERDRDRGRLRYDLVYELFPDLRRRGRQRAGTLSGGQQQMLALGRVLINDNRLLLVDEPTKGLAPRVVTEVVAVLARAAEVSTILLVEQNLPAVRRLARDIAVLAAGQVVHAGPAASLLGDPGRTRELLGVAMREEP